MHLREAAILCRESPPPALAGERPDMSPMLFARAISKGEPIKVFNNGDMIRDFTYIDDIAEGSVHALDHMPVAEKCPNGVPYKVYNIGC